jgi:hypothetical protein
MINEEFITGYQWSSVDNKFMGEYKFPNNKDKEEIHLPPFTTLKKPPEVSKETAAYWEDGEWIIKVDSSKMEEHPKIDNYELLMPDYIEWLKSRDLWTDDDETKYNQALQIAKEKKEEQIRLEKEIEESLDYWEILRINRNYRIQQTDWTQLPDVQNILTDEEKEQWSNYRQQLRDLPDNIVDPKPLYYDENHSDWPPLPN